MFIFLNNKDVTLYFVHILVFLQNKTETLILNYIEYGRKTYAKSSAS